MFIQWHLLSNVYNVSEFQKSVLTKLVEILEEVRRVGKVVEPRDSDFHIKRMERMDELNQLEEQLQSAEERKLMVRYFLVKK